MKRYSCAYNTIANSERAPDAALLQVHVTGSILRELRDDSDPFAAEYARITLSN